MKLIFCEQCFDLVKLDFKKRECKCKMSWGNYNPDGDTATVGGEAKVVGLLNWFFMQFMTKETIEKLNEANGYPKDAWPIFWYPEDNGKITRIKAKETE